MDDERTLHPVNAGHGVDDAEARAELLKRYAARRNGSSSAARGTASASSRPAVKSAERTASASSRPAVKPAERTVSAAEPVRSTVTRRADAAPRGRHLAPETERPAEAPVTRRVRSAAENAPAVPRTASPVTSVRAAEAPKAEAAASTVTRRVVSKTSSSGSAAARKAALAAVGSEPKPVTRVRRSEEPAAEPVSAEGEKPAEAVTEPVEKDVETPAEKAENTPAAEPLTGTASQKQAERRAKAGRTARRPEGAAARYGKRRKKPRTLTAFGWFLVFLMGAAVLTGLYFIHRWGAMYWEPTVVEGVYVDGVSLSGMTYEEADEYLDAERARELGLISIRVTDPSDGRAWQWGAEDLASDIDLSEAKEKLRSLGRTGNVFARRKEVYELMENPVYLSTAIECHTELVSELVDRVEENVNTEPVNAKVSFDTTADPMWTYEEEVYGREIDREKLEADLMNDLQDDFSADAVLTIHDIRPTYTVDDLKRATTNKVTFSTTVGGTDNRKTNVKLALKAVDGTIIWPGEEFSFNGVVGERTEGRGYLEANVIGRNKGYDAGIGGGVCQVSTTIYCCALMADATTTKWRAHSFPSNYVDPGLDATVNWPDKDMCFRNDSDGPMFIKCRYTDDKAYVSIYRLPYDDGVTKVRITSEILYQGETPDYEIQEDTQGEHVTYTDEYYTQVASRPEMQVRNTRQYYAGDELVKEEEIHIAKFSEIVGIRLVGTKERPGGSND